MTDVRLTRERRSSRLATNRAHATRADHRAADGVDDATADRIDRHRLFVDSLELADRLSRRYAQRYHDLDDVRQVARLALHLATSRYDPQRGEFRRYATVTIIGELKKYLRSAGWASHVPRALQEHALTVDRAVETLTNQLMTTPDVASIAEHTGLTSEEVVEALCVRTARYSTSATMLVDRANSTDVENTALFHDAVAHLDPRSRHILHMRFEQGLTQREIGEVLGVSQPQAHRRLSKALAELGGHLTTASGSD